jgi:hypothetical protein
MLFVSGSYSTYVALDRGHDPELFGYEWQRGCNHRRGERFQERKQSHHDRRPSAHLVGPLARINGYNLIIMLWLTCVAPSDLPWPSANRHGLLRQYEDEAGS